MSAEIFPDCAPLHPGYKFVLSARGPDGAQRNPGPSVNKRLFSMSAEIFPDCAPLHPGYKFVLSARGPDEAKRNLG
jgi:hypothetical protein